MLTNADRERILSEIASIEGIEDFILHELRKTRKASCAAFTGSDENRACGLAYAASWLVDNFAADLNINLVDDD